MNIESWYLIVRILDRIISLRRFILLLYILSVKFHSFSFLVHTNLKLFFLSFDRWMFDMIKPSIHSNEQSIKKQMKKNKIKMLSLLYYYHRTISIRFLIKKKIKLFYRIWFKSIWKFFSDWVCLFTGIVSVKTSLNLCTFCFLLFELCVYEQQNHTNTLSCHIHIHEFVYLDRFRIYKLFMFIGIFVKFCRKSSD